MQDQRQEPTGLGLRESFNIGYTFHQVHATCFTPFLRRGFGRNALGFNGIGAFILILSYAALTQSEGMFVYFWAWFAALVLQRLQTGWMALRGHVEHSHYDGRPWVAMLFPFVKSELSARALEPMICFIGWALLCPLSETVGGFVMFGAISLTLVEGIRRYVTQNRLQQMRDAEIEIQALAERFRGERKDF